MDSSVLDGTDRALVHALQLDGRVPFSTIAEILGVSEHTVARRYRRLRSHGVLRVVGVINGMRMGYKSWTIRIRCTPDVATSIAAALARRSDTFWVYVLSGGTEIACNTQPRTPDQLLVAKLPRSRGVLDVSAHELLPGAATVPERATADGLTHEQAARIRPPEAARLDEPVSLDPADHRMLNVLGRDGRATYAELATATGWSQSTVARRMRHLRHAGVVTYEVELPPATIGFRAEARLWMSARPSALASTAATLNTHPEVVFAAVTTGPTNLVAQVNCADSTGLYQYLTERVATLDGVNTMETAPVLHTVKRFGSPL